MKNWLIQTLKQGEEQGWNEGYDVTVQITWLTHVSRKGQDSYNVAMYILSLGFVPDAYYVIIIFLMSPMWGKAPTKVSVKQQFLR